MDRMLYTAMSGAKQSMLAQAINSNNLANISTTGFRADLAVAKSMPLFGDGFPSRVFTMVEQPGTDFKNGALNSTGRELDVAIGGAGFIAIQGTDGTEAYTRAGDLKINNAGILQTGTGRPVLGEGGPITIPEAQKIEIGRDGTVSIVSAGADSSDVIVVDRIKLVNPELTKIKKNEQGLFVLKKGGSVGVDENVTLISGTLETSNVNAAEALVNMIELARQFEMQIKMLKTAEENNSYTTQIMRLG